VTREAVVNKLTQAIMSYKYILEISSRDIRFETRVIGCHDRGFVNFLSVNSGKHLDCTLTEVTTVSFHILSNTVLS